jgi:hypothetical protein
MESLEITYEIHGCFFVDTTFIFYKKSENIFNKYLEKYVKYDPQTMNEFSRTSNKSSHRAKNNQHQFKYSIPYNSQLDPIDLIFYIECD